MFIVVFDKIKLNKRTTNKQKSESRTKHQSTAHSTGENLSVAYLPTSSSSWQDGFLASSNWVFGAAVVWWARVVSQLPSRRRGSNPNPHQSKAPTRGMFFSGTP